MNCRKPAPAFAGIMASRTAFAILLFAAVAGVGLPAARLHAESANTDFKRGQAAEARADYDTAFDDYQKALNRNPRDARFKIALARMRVTASSAHVTQGPQAVPGRRSCKERWQSFCTPPKSIRATRPRSRRLPACGRSRARTRRCPRLDCRNRLQRRRNWSRSRLRPSSSRFRTSRSRCT